MALSIRLFISVQDEPSFGSGTELTVGVDVDVDVGVGVLVCTEVGEVEGVGEMATFGTTTFTPEFHTIFFPDLTHVNLYPLIIVVCPIFLQIEVGLLTADATLIRKTVENAIDKVAKMGIRRLFI